MTDARFYVAIATDEGDVAVYEDELATITKADLKMLGITRSDLDYVFEEGKRLMKDRGIEPGDRTRIRPVAAEHLDGSWEVILVGYSPKSDPLLNDGGKVPLRGKRN